MQSGGVFAKYINDLRPRRALQPRVRIRISIIASAVLFEHINLNSSELRLLEPDVRE